MAGHFPGRAQVVRNGNLEHIYIYCLISGKHYGDGVLRIEIKSAIDLYMLHFFCNQNHNSKIKYRELDVHTNSSHTSLEVF